MNKYTEKLNEAYKSFDYILGGSVTSAAKCAIHIDAKFVATNTSNSIYYYFHPSKAYLDILDLDIRSTPELINEVSSEKSYDYFINKVLGAL